MSDSPGPRLPGNSSPPRVPRGGRTAEQANAATFAALFGLGLVAFALIGIVALVLPQIRGLVLVACAAIGFFAAHYVLWGWWLPKLIRRDSDAE